MHKIAINGVGKSAVATPDEISRKKKKTTKRSLAH